MSWPSIDHSILSPSGRVSERTRQRSMERVRRELFGDGLAHPKCQQLSEREAMLQQATRLQELADRGMKPRAYAKEAARLRRLAETL